jgi:hypothetical protein
MDETDPTVRATVAAAMIAAERQADAIYGALRVDQCQGKFMSDRSSGGGRAE